MQNKFLNKEEQEIIISKDEKSKVQGLLKGRFKKGKGKPKFPFGKKKPKTSMKALMPKKIKIEPTPQKEKEIVKKEPVK